MSESDQPAEGLPREEPATSTSERARHWADFYTELIGYEERILDAMRTLSAGMSAREMDAVRKTNLEPLENLIEDFRRRLALWRTRLEADEVDSRDPDH